MVITYEDVNPTLIENTTMQKKLLDGVFKVYTVKANDGYILHDNNCDMPEYDEETWEETGKIILGFRPSTYTATCAANYDFVANPRDFYAIPRNKNSEGEVTI
ncbi:MAG: hypothetical protein IKK37_03460 [Clostridia bacterium]|nr:hypothetical protein [Clostridia bacterium]